MGEKEHHVHFSGGNGLGFNNITIKPQRHGYLDAHLGFLQRHHRYHIEFVVPWNGCIHEEDTTRDRTVIVNNCNPNCVVHDVTHEKDDLRLRIELLASHEFLKELIQLKCCQSGSPLNITLKGRVLSKDKGTPMLRNGIKSIGIVADDDDDDVSE